MSELQIQNLSYQNIGPLDLEIAGAECVCLSGPSGAGKTLLLRALADLDPHQGRVFLDKVERSSFSAPEWRRNVVMLPAESQWWADTVGEHFNEYQEHSFNALGFGRDVLSWQTNRLSTGERQRLALLRVLALAPDALLLDEPTANLDAENTSRVEALLTNYLIKQSAAMLWVSHNREQIQRVAGRWLQFESNCLREAALQ